MDPTWKKGCTIALVILAVLAAGAIAFFAICTASMRNLK
jgi:hypothetical protein